MTDKMTFSVKEAAELLSLNPETIRRAHRSGKIQAAMLGEHGKLLVSRVELERFWKAHGGGQLFPHSDSGAAKRGRKVS